jgi:hypothetical protein
LSCGHDGVAIDYSVIQRCIGLIRPAVVPLIMFVTATRPFGCYAIFSGAGDEVLKIAMVVT